MQQLSETELLAHMRHDVLTALLRSGMHQVVAITDDSVHVSGVENEFFPKGHRITIDFYVQTGTNAVKRAKGTRDRRNAHLHPDATYTIAVLPAHGEYGRKVLAKHEYPQSLAAYTTSDDAIITATELEKALLTDPKISTPFLTYYMPTATGPQLYMTKTGHPVLSYRYLGGARKAAIGYEQAAAKKWLIENGGKASIPLQTESIVVLPRSILRDEPPNRKRNAIFYTPHWYQQEIDRRMAEGSKRVA